MFDIVFIQTHTDTSQLWKRLKARFPLAKKASSVEKALKVALTEFVWIVPDDVIVDEDFLFDYMPDEWSKQYVHVFKNGNTYDGVALVPVNIKLSSRELQYRFYVNKKEIDITASIPRPYDLFLIENYQDYKFALENATTELFWMSSNMIAHDVDLVSNYYISHHDSQLRNQTHAFIHNVDEQRLYNGLFLCSKQRELSEREVEYRFPVNRIEHDTVGSTKKTYSVVVCNTYDEYITAIDNTSITELFWTFTSNVTLDPNFTMDLYFSHDNEYDRKSNHSFIHRVDGKDYRNGVFLLTKHRPLTQREFEHRFIVNSKEWDIVASGPVEYPVYEIDSYEEYVSALESSPTEMFWMSSRNISATIPNLYFTHDNEFDRKTNHNFLHCGDKRNGVFLCSKHRPLTQKEIEHRFLVNAKEWNIVASGPVEYDHFYIDSYTEYLEALENSKTELFWADSRNIKSSIPDIYFTHDNEFDRKTNHNFLHVGEKRNGLFLLSKHAPITAKEIEHRFIINAKEWGIVGSDKVEYPVYEIDSYDEYMQAVNACQTEMFWMSSRNISATIPDIYFTHDNEFDRKQNHAFIHRVVDNDLYNGLFLCSKHRLLTQKEVNHRHIVNRKEWDIVASGPVKYEKFIMDTYDDYVDALNKAQTEMFWAVSNNLKITDNFNFDIYFSHDNVYDRTQNHAFIHRVDGKDLYNGVFLLSKHRPLTKREIEHRYIVNRKEWDIVASGPCQYEIFYPKVYEDYLDALKTSKTEMFWIVPDYINTTERFKFDTYFSFDQTYDREINHAYLNGKYHDGILLCSKYAKFSKREFDYRFIANKKEVNIVVSTPRPYDIVFISYQEPNADEYYKYLTDRFPKARRVHGVKGIHQAHIEAARLCETDMFWIVDGDALIDSKFKFNYQVARWDQDTVHVWRSVNPINDLVYGYGGVKLFPTELTLNMDTSKPDMTTSISNKFRAVQEISNTTAFNTDPFNTWKSAFRECAKLSSKIIDRQKDDETQERLNVWCTKGKDRPFGNYAITGAKMGALYGARYQNDKNMLKKINDFDWLKEQFDARNI